VLVDFDRTVFQTDLFHLDVENHLMQTIGFSLNLHTRTYSSEDRGAVRFEDLHAFLLESKQLTHQMVSSLLDQATQGRDYIFPDARRWLEEEKVKGAVLHFVTSGQDKLQNYKLGLDEVTAGVGRTIVGQNKGEMLTKNVRVMDEGGLGVQGLPYVARRLLLIDDRPDTFNQLESVVPIERVRIRRPGLPYSCEPTPSGVREVHTFEGIRI
jgi:hypothetical protein